MMSKYYFVLVHLGKNFSNKELFGENTCIRDNLPGEQSYINECIKQIQKFNKCPVYFIGSSEHSNKIEDKNIIYINEEDIIKTQVHREFLQRSALSKGFWLDATQRFFYIENLMEHLKLKNVFHIECDNLLYSDLENTLPIFEQNYTMAGTFDAKHRCVPGFMYYKNSIFLKTYLESIINNESKNDMATWGTFRMQYPNLIQSLPIAPLGYQMSQEDHKLLTNNITQFNSLFDAAEKGQYLDSVSPRNGGYTKHNNSFINETCVYKIDQQEKCTFTFENDEQGRRILYMSYGSKEKYRVNNLHVHSKRLHKFLSA